MSAIAMPRGKLLGIRLSPEEVEELDQLAALLEAETPGARFNHQAVVRIAIAALKREHGLTADAPPAAPSRPRAKPVKRSR